MTKITYDTSKRVSTIIRVTNTGAGTGPTTTFTYNSGNTVVNDPNSHNTTYTYDNMGRVTSVLDALSHTQSATYNTDSNVLTYTDAMPTGNVTNYTYGANNGESLTQMQLPTNGTTQKAYTDATHPYKPSSKTDAQGSQFTYAYDTPGNKTSTTNQLSSNNQTSATYNTNGTVATTTDAMGHVTTYTYTYTSGVLSKIVIAPPTVTPNPLGSVTRNIDTLGRMASRVDGKSQTTTYTFDNLDRVTRITYNGDTTCSSRNTCTDYGYDFNGNLTSRIDSTGTTSFTYDKLNRQLTKTLPGAGSASVTYTYDSVGNLLSVADAGGTVTYHYNAVNLLDSLSEPGGSCSGTVSLCTTFTYDNNNRLLTTTYPNTVVLTRVYDNAARLTSITGKKGLTTLTSFAYTYTVGSNDTVLRQTMTTGGVTTTYSYDKLNRLTGAVATGANYQYTYDGNGNWLTATLNGTSTFATPTYNAVDELTALGSTTYTYDGNGNLASGTGGLALAYNTKDQTTSITPAGGSALAMTYAGDDQVQRLTAGSDSFAYGVLGLSLKTNSGTTYYTRDNHGRLVGQRVGTSTYYYLFDGLGSVVALTDSTGAASDTYTYDPYGNVTATGSVTNPWQYTGGYYDSTTKLVKLGHRFYDPSLGRWTQRDPLGHRYVYASDNPVSFTDITGLESDEFDTTVEYYARIAEVAGLIVAAAGAEGPGLGITIAAGIVDIAARTDDMLGNPFLENLSTPQDFGNTSGDTTGAGYWGDSPPDKSWADGFQPFSSGDNG